MFQAKRQILLTGAGFSKDFGGYLATEMWSVIFSQPEIRQHSDLREHLLKQLNYEIAYNEVMYSNRFKVSAKSDFTRAVARTYQQMHEAYFQQGVRIPATGVCRAIVRRFAGTGGMKRGLVFTLNQDLFVERFFSNGDSPSDLRIPGISNYGYFNYSLPKELIKDYEVVLPKETQVQKLEADFWEDKAHGEFVYLKLHGSYWWRSTDGSDAMVIGGEKTKLIDREPYLKWCHSIFEKVLSGPECNLVVIGYGFGDKHINRVIAKSIREHGLKLYVVSPERPEDFQKKLEVTKGVAGKQQERSHEGLSLWKGLHGYYCCNVTKLYEGNNGELTPMGRSLFENIGL